MARGIDEKPYLEWLDGLESVAVSPNTAHGIVAGNFARLFERQGHGFGTAIAELHLRLNDEPRRTVLLPDVVFYRNAALLELDRADRLLPNVPPEIIVEVRSPNGRPGFRESKIDRYVAWGCPLVFDADPRSRTLVVHARSLTRTLHVSDSFEDPDVPWLRFHVGEVFERLDLFGF